MPAPRYAPRYDSSGRKLDTEADMQDTLRADVDEKMRKTNLGSKGKSAAGAPKQEPGESASSYASRYRKYREGLTANDQANALDKRK